MTIVIKKPTEDYITKMLELASEFYNKNQYTKGRGWLNKDALDSIIRQGMESEDKVFFRMILKDNEAVGFFLAFAFENLLFHLSLAQEQGFYCRKPIGLKATGDVIREFEEWAAEVGADFVVMSALAGTKAGKLYERYGYEHSESAYAKPVNHSADQVASLS